MKRVMEKKRLSTADKIGLLVQTNQWTAEHGVFPDDPAEREKALALIGQRVDHLRNTKRRRPT